MKDKDKTKVSFVDSMSAEEVTGSSILVETPNYKRRRKAHSFRGGMDSLNKYNICV